MTAGDAEGNPGDYQPYDEPKSVQPSPVVNDDIMERERRNEARKRLDGDMKSSSPGQHALPPSEALPYEFSSGVNPNQLEAHKNEACVYSGRNWKRDARRTHLFKELTDPSNVPGGPSPSVKRPPFEAGSHLESHRNPAAKRDWKADARKKAAVDVGNRENHPTV